MRINTNISNVIDGNANKNKYDTEVKKVLSDKTILAWIMKFSVREFEKYSIDEIRECIEGEPEIAEKNVRPGHRSEVITGMNTEDSVPGEGKITYDIRFYAVIPGGEYVKLIINVEAQKSFYPGYDIVTRAVFYCARLLSAQLDEEFTPENYNNIKKVYSIWICMDVPQKVEHTITKYHMTEEKVGGQVDMDARYDLLEVVMVYLGREETSGKGTKLHGLLSTLLSEELKPEQKKEILSQKYDIATSVELEGGFDRMCNLSEMIEEKGIRQGIRQGIEEGTIKTLISLVEKGRLTVEEAAEEAKTTVDAFKKLLDRAAIGSGE